IGLERFPVSSKDRRIRTVRTIPRTSVRRAVQKPAEAVALPRVALEVDDLERSSRQRVDVGVAARIVRDHLTAALEERAGNTTQIALAHVPSIHDFRQRDFTL